MQYKLSHNYTLRSISGKESHPEVVQRLLDFGFYDGMVLRILHKLPMGGAWVIESGSLYIALREEEFSLLDLV